MQTSTITIGCGLVLGVDAIPVQVEATTRNAGDGTPRLLGLVDTCVREAYHRVLQAFFALDLPPPRKPKRRRAAKVRVEPRPEPEVEDDDAGEEDDVAEDDAPRDRPPPSAARFALRAMLAVTLGYALLSVYFYTHPSRVGELLGSVPVIGQQLAEARLNPASIQLTDVRGEYARVKGDLLVFVVSGVAINNAPVPVSGIQIQGRISGKDDVRQVVFCGAAPRDVHDLTAREIDLLQTLTPPKDWMLAVGFQHFRVLRFGDRTSGTTTSRPSATGYSNWAHLPWSAFRPAEERAPSPS